jgi:hypothetical protein
VESFSREYFMGIKTKEDFLSFLKTLERDCLEGEGSWVNGSIGGYLESIRAWATDRKFGGNDGLDWDSPNWPLIALLFYSGKIYE